MSTKRIHELTQRTGILNPTWSIPIDSSGFSETEHITIGQLGTNTYQRTITQSAHGFVVGNLLSFSGSIYEIANTSSLSRANIVGIVSEVVSSNSFTLITTGFVTGLSGLTAGQIYYLTTVSGTLTTTIPTTGLLKPAFVAISANEVFLINSFPRNASTEQAEFTVTSPTQNLPALGVTTFTLDIPSNRFFGVYTSISGLALGESCTVQFSYDDTHVSAHYVGNFTNELPIDNSMGWRYRDGDGIKKLHVKVSNTTTSAIVVQVSVKGEPF